MPPPMKPWIARQTIIWPIDDDSPHIKLATVKPAAAVANMARVPSARERKPENGIATTSAIKYDVCTQVISSLEAASPAFAKAWAAHDVAPLITRVKSFRHPGVGTVRITSTSFAVSVPPGARMVVYTAADEESRIALDKLAAGLGTDAHFPCWPAHQPERAALTGAAS